MLTKIIHTNLRYEIQLHMGLFCKIKDLKHLNNKHAYHLIKVCPVNITPTDTYSKIAHKNAIILQNDNSKEQRKHKSMGQYKTSRIDPLRDDTSYKHCPWNDTHDINTCRSHLCDTTAWRGVSYVTAVH